jgi:hypothetical protein
VNQRVFVTTVEGTPSFLVHARVRDCFIAEEVERRHGKQPNEEPHEWEAFDEVAEIEGAQAQGGASIETLGAGTHL